MGRRPWCRLDAALRPEPNPSVPVQLYLLCQVSLCARLPLQRSQYELLPANTHGFSWVTQASTAAHDWKTCLFISLHLWHLTGCHGDFRKKKKNWVCLSSQLSSIFIIIIYWLLGQRPSINFKKSLDRMNINIFSNTQVREFCLCTSTTLVLWNFLSHPSKFLLKLKNLQIRAGHYGLFNIQIFLVWYILP